MVQRRVLLSFGACTLVSACGFALRQNPRLPFRSIALLGFRAASPLAAELSLQLGRDADLKVRSDRAKAEVVLVALIDTREKNVTVSTAVGQVREYELKTQLVYQIEDANGKILAAESELLLKRDMSYNESQALGKQQEEQFLFQAMQTDAVTQLMQRLAVVTTSKS